MPDFCRCCQLVFIYGLIYGSYIRIFYRMKTRKEAVDFALTEAQRIARLNRLFENPWTSEEMKKAVDPHYDLMALREKEKPRSTP